MVSQGDLGGGLCGIRSAGVGLRTPGGRYVCHTHGHIQNAKVNDQFILNNVNQSNEKTSHLWFIQMILSQVISLASRVPKAFHLNESWIILAYKPFTWASDDSLIHLSLS